MNFDIAQLFDFIVPIVTGVVGWLAGKRKRNNDFLNDLQASVNLLSEENKNLLAEVVELRKENAALLINQGIMQNEMSKLREENVVFRNEIEELNTRLTGVKTITRLK